jgi:CBS domain-containing protein
MGKHPPFDLLPQAELLALAGEVTIAYRPKNERIFSENQAPKDYFYMVHKGAIALKRPSTQNLVDLCDEGDVFGLRPLMAQEQYKLDAVAHEESILYAIPIAIFKPLAVAHKEVGDFLIESFASNTRNPYSRQHRGKLYGDSTNTTLGEPDTKLFDFQPVPYSKKIVCCAPQTPVQELALKMTEKKVGAMLIVDKGLPVGIITDIDLRDKVVSGKFPIIAPASEIMRSPVITYPKQLTVTQAQMALMKSGINYLCITQDGSPNSPAVGMVSEHDVMLAVGNNPAVLMKAIKRARKTKHLKPIRNGIQQLLAGYLELNLPMRLTTKIISELNDACTKQVLQIALSRMGTPPPVPFAWLSLGSQGRSEQLLRTDQDNALVYADVPETEVEATKTYFMELAQKVTKRLHKIGYDYCPAEMMASNPNWCHSVSDWKTKVTEWIAAPGPDEVLLSAIFFDFNLSYGDEKLVNALSDHVFDTVAKYPVFLTHLASGALKNPSPTGFFLSFLVEQNGTHKDQFDLKRRALLPLTDAARVLSLSHRIKSINSTEERFEKLAEIEPNNAQLYRSCSYATKALLKFRVKQGLLHNDSGRFIALDSLSKEEKIKLKRTFKTIKDLQDLLGIRYNASNRI